MGCLPSLSLPRGERLGKAQPSWPSAPSPEPWKRSGASLEPRGARDRDSAVPPSRGAGACWWTETQASGRGGAREARGREGSRLGLWCQRPRRAGACPQATAVGICWRAVGQPRPEGAGQQETPPLCPLGLRVDRRLPEDSWASPWAQDSPQAGCQPWGSGCPRGRAGRRGQLSSTVLWTGEALLLPSACDPWQLMTSWWDGKMVWWGGGLFQWYSLRCLSALTGSQGAQPV